MSKKTNFIKFIQLWVIIIIVMIGVSMVALDVVVSYQEFNSRADQMRTDYTSEQKQIIRREVKRVVDMIRYEKMKSEALTRTKIKSRAYEACAIAQHIYQKNKAAKNEHEIQQMIIDALRPIRFEQGSGYYFIVAFDGIQVLFADKPELEGRNQLNMQDTRGQYVIKDSIEIAKKSGEGFYEYLWTKPNVKGNDFKKISFIKRFEPYDWFIGTGLYVDDIENRIKADLLSDISRIRFGKEGYVFVNRLNGDALVSNGKRFAGTKKLWEVFNKKPEKIKNVFKKEYNASLKPDGDYIYYSWIKLTQSNIESPKASFIYGIPELQWLVGAGVYLDDVETVIARMQTELTNQIKTKMLYSILITLGIIAFFLILFSWLNRRLKKDFNLFMSFFNRAALSDEPIDRDRVRFDELDRMAENANKMLADRKRTEEELKESEEKYRLLFTHSNDVIYSLDPEFKILTVSPSVEKLLGYTPEELIGRPFQDLNILAPEYLELAFSNTTRILSGESITSIIYEFITKDGLRKFGEVSGAPLYHNNKIVGIIAAARDITERRLMEQTLRENEERYRQIFENIQDIYFETSLDGTILEVSPSVEKFSHYKRDALIGKSLFDIYAHPQERDKLVKILIENGRINDLEVQLKDKDGSIHPYSFSSMLIKDNQGIPIKVVGSMRDISGRKQAEKRLRESEEKYRFLTEKTADIVWTLDRDFRTTYVSPSIEKVLGFTPEERKQQTLEEMITPETLSRVQQAFMEELQHDEEIGADPNRFVIIEIEYYHKNGSTVYMENNMKWTRDHTGKIDGIYGVSRDITERRLMEQTLRENELKFRSLFDFSPQAIALTEKETGRLMDVNQKFCELTQYDKSELLGKTTTEMGFYSQTDRERFIAEFKTHGTVNGLEMDFITKDGSVLTELMFCRLVSLGDGPYLLTIFVDVTQQKNLENQLRQAQKMESIGTLSGGIAHDFNNVLSIIIGNTELALDDVPEANSAHFNLEEIKSAGLRAKNIVSQLLAFSRKTDQDLKPVAIVPVIKDAIQFLRSTIPASIDIYADIDDAGETVLADPVGLNQVMMNLCINASHAMEQTGGVLTVNMESVILDTTSDKNEPGLPPGDYVKITVSDTGPGIDPKIFDKIFDPYFTTKGVGKGSGMGLAVVHGIVKNHNGTIFVDSEPGKGAVFSILLPKIDEKPEVKAEPSMDLPTGSETILFVDDEPSIMKLGQRMMERLGYSVDATLSSTEALKRFRAAPDTYDLVITDMTMPEMTGVALAEALMRIRADIPVIICTGHSALIDEEKAKTLDIAAFVMKPMTRQKIARIIRQVLNNEK